MKFPTILKKITTSEIVLFFIFGLYLMSSVQTPTSISPYLNSPLGILLLFAITLSFFFYMNPLLGIVFVFVVYELLRRSVYSLQILGNNVRPSLFLSDTSEKKIDVAEPEPQSQPVLEPSTLEEQVVSKMAPIAISPTPIENSNYQPVADNIRNAFFI